MTQRIDLSTAPERSRGDIAAGSIYAKQRNLPGQIDRAIRRVRQLMIEAERYAMPELVDATWDRIITEAQADARKNGGSIGFGEGRR